MCESVVIYVLYKPACSYKAAPHTLRVAELIKVQHVAASPLILNH